MPPDLEGTIVRKMTLLVVICLIALPSIALAQYGMANYEQTQEWRVRAGWFDMGDADDGLGVGVDYMFEAVEQDWMAGLEWGDAGSPTPAMQVEQVGSSGIDNYWGLTFNWIGRTQQSMDESMGSGYYGIGAGWYRLDDGSDDDSFGGQALIGGDFAEDWFVDIRYVFGTDLFDNADVDGLRACVGYRIK